MGLPTLQPLHLHIFFNCVETMDRITCGLIVLRISLVLSMPITIKVVRLNPSHGEEYSIKHYVIKFVSGLRRSVALLWFSGFLRQPPTSL